MNKFYSSIENTKVRNKMSGVNNNKVFKKCNQRKKKKSEHISNGVGAWRDISV